MDSPGVPFDVAAMRVDRTGRVNDRSGAPVGRIVFTGSGGPAAYRPPAADTPPAQRYAPPPQAAPPEPPQASAAFRIDRSGNALDSSGRVVGFVAGARRSGEDFNNATLNKRGKVVSESGRVTGRLVMDGAGAEDLARRRERLTRRIESELSGQNITSEQAAALRQELAASARSEAGFKRDGTLSDREIARLYVGWDRTAERLDRFLAANARTSVGLRTRY